MQSSVSERQIPRQRRAQATVGAILEAALQLLQAGGARAFTTNGVAARAGVSIGTLYRYFPDKRAILAALARREMAAFNDEVAAVLAGQRHGLAPDRAMIRAFLQAFGGRGEARRRVIAALLAHSDARDLAAGFAPVANAFADADGRPLTPAAAFVLSRAVHGAMRAAVLEGSDLLFSRAFEDELVRLGRSYLGYPVSPRA